MWFKAHCSQNILKKSYASFVWAHEVTSEQPLLQLRRLDRVAMMAITACRQSTPTRGMAVVMGILPSHLFLWKNSVNTLVRHPELAELGWSGKSHTILHSTSHRLHWKTAAEDHNIELHTDRLRRTAPPPRVLSHPGQLLWRPEILQTKPNQCIH